MAERVYPPLVMPDGVGRHQVTVWSNGIALDADVYRPASVDSGAALPAVVLCHGWGGSKLTAERYAALFASAGMITLTFTQGSWFGPGSPLQLVGDAPDLKDGNEAQFWDSDFPGLIPGTPLACRPIPADGFELEGHRITAIQAGHTDTDDTTVRHVPSIGLIVAGDVVYNGVHQYLLETPGGGFESWLAALDMVESLNPRAVVAGHKNRDLPDDPATVDQTRQYLRDAQRLLAGKPAPRQFFDEMIARYPDRLNTGPLWYGAHGLLGNPAAEVTADQPPRASE